MYHEDRITVLVTDVFKSHLNFSKHCNFQIVCVDLWIILEILRSSSGPQQSIFQQIVWLIYKKAFSINPHMHEMGPQGPKRHIIDKFYLKMLESSDFIYSSIFLLENIWYNFTWSGPNSTRNCGFYSNLIWVPRDP